MELVFGEMSGAERYKFLTALIVPRPVALVVTRGENGVHNAAPFSFFNVFSEEPPLIVLGINLRPDGRKKDTLVNIRKSGEFVVHMVDKRVVEAMHVASADVPHGESEIDFAEVTLAPSRIVGVPRIVEAPVALECRVFQIMDISELRALVLGEGLCLHVRDEIIDPATRRVIPERYSPIARLFGDHYAWLGERYTRAIPSYDALVARRAARGEAAE